jgi:ketosteroid isomerase-like protein
MVQDHWVLRRFAVVDAKDIDGFIDMLTEDHRFVFGARAPAIGKTEAREQVLHFWSLIGRLRHNIRRVTAIDDLVYVEADVDYERLDGHSVTVPCCDVIRIRGDRICEQRAYLDQAPVWTDAVERHVPFEALRADAQALQGAG